MSLLIYILGVSGVGFMLFDVSTLSETKYLPFPTDLFKPEDENCGDPGEPLILTPLIRSGKIQEARDLARVADFTNVTSYSGFFTVRKKFNANMFFWFFPSPSDKKDVPIVLWLQGGPGLSSLSGLFDENGPFIVDSHIKMQLRKKYAWTFTHSVIYIDNPVGTGFSFTDDGGYAKNQEEVGCDLYEALRQFFHLFPEYRSRDLYIAGESNGGKFIPAVSYKIHMENQIPSKIKINLRGFAIGNPWLDPENQINYGDFLYSIGLIDQNQRLHFHKEEEKAKEFIRNSKWIEALDLINTLIAIVETYPAGSYFGKATGFNYYYNFLYNNDPYPTYFTKFVEKNCTRQAIHVGKVEYTGSYEASPKVVQNMLEDICQSVKPWIQVLLDAKESYRILIYSGNLDILCAHPLTDRMIRKLKWNGANEFKETTRNVWRLGGELVGYVKTVNNFTHVTILNAGHFAIRDKPKVVYEVINRLTYGQPFLSNDVCF